MSLVVDYDYLRRAVGRFLGYGRNTASWTSDQSQDVADIIDSGLRRFYWPPLLKDERTRHTWSFLQPSATLTTVASDYAYDLPAGFNSLVGGFTFAPSVAQFAIQRIEEPFLRALQAKADANGAPAYCAIRIKPHVVSQDDVHEVLFYPTPDASYVLSFRYSITPSTIDATDTVPLGGAAHGETVLESCLAAAELSLNDQIGIHSARFLEALSASVQLDQEQQGLTIKGVKK